MLSYMLPVDEKPPPVPTTTTTTTKNHMQLQLRRTTTNEQLPNGRHSSPISKETSVSSFISDGTTATATSSMTSTSDKSKPKLVLNGGGKHQTLKRVSFGSSKGSMVETLIFESPVQEEPEPSPIPENVIHPFLEDHDQNEAEREKVRVTFFQQSKPQEVDLPDEAVVFTNNDFIMATPVTMNDSNHIVYNRTESTESGWDNPFRPGGDLSREADEIVELIKGGKPITPTPGSQAPPLPSLDSSNDDTTINLSNEVITESPKKATELNSSITTNNTTITATTTPPKSLNGNVKNDKSPTTMPQQQQQQSQPGAVDVKRGTIKPDGDASQIEHVTIKKKPKCKCCVIQ